MRVVASVVILVAVVAACGGAAESNVLGEVPDAAASSGSAGNASSSGTTSGTGSSSSSGCGLDDCSSSSSSSGIIVVDAGFDSGGPGNQCTVNADTCQDTEYCKTQGCNAVGVCAPRPTVQSTDLSPVCGCDKVTYWNASVAEIHGVNVATKAACGSAGVLCTKNPGCAGGAKCNLEQASICSISEVKGTCWQLPKSCESSTSRQVRRCSNAQCTTLCAAIADERQFTAGTGCP